MKNSEHIHRTYYVCKGECAAMLKEEDYAKHETKVCGDNSCSHKGQPFVKEEFCETCMHPCDEQHSCC